MPCSMAQLWMASAHSLSVLALTTHAPRPSVHTPYPAATASSNTDTTASPDSCRFSRRCTNRGKVREEGERERLREEGEVREGWRREGVRHQTGGGGVGRVGWVRAEANATRRSTQRRSWRWRVERLGWRVKKGGKSQYSGRVKEGGTGKGGVEVRREVGEGEEEEEVGEEAGSEGGCGLGWGEELPAGRGGRGGCDIIASRALPWRGCRPVVCVGCRCRCRCRCCGVVT